MNKFKLITLLAGVVITACSPQKLQNSRLETYRNGKPFYRMMGYTGMRETEPKSSVKYIKEALSDACPAGIVIDELHEYPDHNSFGEFLYWEAIAGCK